MHNSRERFLKQLCITNICGCVTNVCEGVTNVRKYVGNVCECVADTYRILQMLQLSSVADVLTSSADVIKNNAQNKKIITNASYPTKHSVCHIIFPSHPHVTFIAAHNQLIIKTALPPSAPETRCILFH